MPGAPGGLKRSRVLANSGKDKFRTLERTVFFGNVHLVLRSMLTEAAAPLKSKGIDTIGPDTRQNSEEEGEKTGKQSKAQS